MTPPAAVTFRRGQAVRWPPAPGGLAQVDELRRTTVVVLYRDRAGRVRRPAVRAAALAALHREPPLPLFNLMGRAPVRGQRTYEVLT